MMYSEGIIGFHLSAEQKQIAIDFIQITIGITIGIITRIPIQIPIEITTGITAGNLILFVSLLYG